MIYPTDNQLLGLNHVIRQIARHFQHADVIEHSKQNHQKKAIYYKIFLLEHTGFNPSISYDVEAGRPRLMRQAWGIFRAS